MPEESQPPERIPAFESSIGLAPASGPGAIVVDKQKLDQINEEIKSEHKEIMAHHQEAVQIASLFAARAIRPDEVAALRRQMMDTVVRGMVEVDKVIQGKKTWTTTQTRLFAILAERVMPKLSSLTIQDANPIKRLEEMSLEELEALALGKKKADAVDAVVKNAELLDEQAEKHERREAKRDVVAGLAYVNALDEAEKKYIARQMDRSSEQIAEAEMRQRAKPQPKHTPEQLEKLRAARRVPLRDHWRAQGYSEEEVEQKWQDMQRKRQVTKMQLKAERLARIAVKGGLGEDEIDMAKTLYNTRVKTMREFRVHNAKGVRSQSKLTREAARRDKQAAREKERKENPTLRLKGVEGAPEDGVIGLREFREKRPDLFVPDEQSGLGGFLKDDEE